MILNKQCGMGKSFSGTPEKVLPVRIKELVYGNVQQGDNLVKGVQARMLAPVLKIHDRTRGTVYELCKVFLCPAFCLSLALDLPA